MSKESTEQTTTQSPSSLASLKARAFSGVLWTFGSQLIVFGAQFGTLAVLARLLSESEMGVVTLAMTVSNVALVMGGMGLSRALVQQKAPSEVDFATGFWGSTGFGALGWVALVLLAPVLAAFYQEDQLSALVMVSGAGMVLMALPQVHMARLERGLKFKELGVAYVLGYALPYGVVAISAALMGAGAWSPVLGSLAGFAGQAAALMRFERWRPAWAFDTGSLVKMLGFGAGITGASLVAFGLDNIDYFIVGKVRGSAELGLYTIAFQITAMPRSKISSAVTKVAFPAFSQIQDDLGLLNRSYIKLNRSVAFITFPMMAGLFVVAGPFVELVLGAKWLAAVPALEVMCVAGALMSVRATASTVFNSLGRADLGLYANLGVLAVAVVVLLWLAPMGIEMAAVAVVIIAAVNFFPMQWMLRSLTGLDVGKLLWALVAPTIMSVLMAAAVYGALLPIESSPARLLLGIPIGVVVYAALAWVFARDFVTEILGMIRRRRRGGQKSDASS